MKIYWQSLLLGTLLVVALFSRNAIALYDSTLEVHGALNFANSSELSNARAAGLEQSARRGYMFGVGADLGIYSYFSLQPEINYTQRGTRLSQTSGLSTQAGIYEVDYLAIPLLAKFKLLPRRTICPYVYLGPEIAFRTSARYTTETTTNGNTTGSQSTDVSERFRDVDFNGVLGGGLDVLVSNTVSIFGDLRYSQGLRAVAKEIGTNRDITLSTMQILSGIRVGL